MFPNAIVNVANVKSAALNLPEITVEVAFFRLQSHLSIIFLTLYIIKADDINQNPISKIFRKILENLVS